MHCARLCKGKGPFHSDGTFDGPGGGGCGPSLPPFPIQSSLPTMLPIDYARRERGGVLIEIRTSPPPSGFPLGVPQLCPGGNAGGGKREAGPGHRPRR